VPYNAKCNIEYYNSDYMAFYHMLLTKLYAYIRGESYKIKLYMGEMYRVQ